MSNNKLSHLDNHGNANMVDISDKPPTSRSATAEAYVLMQKETLNLILTQGLDKGDVFATARIAGIQAAKKCADLIPLCHPLALTKVNIDLSADTSQHRIYITATCKLNGKTGVEMEALTAASVTALTLYDMCKAVDKTMTITGLRVIEKRGGKSGDWHVT